MITKIQKLSAIHNDEQANQIQDLLFMITKIQKLSAIHNTLASSPSQQKLFMITKIQKLSAIHNYIIINRTNTNVVYDYKDTKIVSNSQLSENIKKDTRSCL